MDDIDKKQLLKEKQDLEDEVTALNQSFNPLSDRQDKARQIRKLVDEKRMRIAHIESLLNNEE